VAGRLIRELKYFDEVGYVEHEWDGTDEAGVEVANGVYYLRFVARRGDERIERIEKMARLR
jgi:flagellar hook assembly protein FlgD